MALAYFRSFTIDHTKCGSGNSTDFPVLIDTSNAATGTKTSFKTVGNGGQVQNANGYDIRAFSDAALTSALFYQLVNYNASTGVLEMWVKVPTLDVATDVVIYLGYGDASLSSDGSSTSTWNSAYKGIYHLKDGTTLSALDATVNARNGTVTGAAAGAGKINGGASFTEAGSNRIALSTVANMASAGAGTYECWFNLIAFTGAAARQVLGDNGGYSFLQLNITARMGMSIFSGSGKTVTDSLALSFSTWYQFVGTWDGTNVKLYRDGGSLGSLAGGSLTATTGTVFIGDRTAGTGSPGAIIDEARTSNVARSADWILAQYNNQAIPDANVANGFYTVGAETAVVSTAVKLRIHIGHRPWPFAPGVAR